MWSCWNYRFFHYLVFCYKGTEKNETETYVPLTFGQKSSQLNEDLKASEAAPGVLQNKSNMAASPADKSNMAAVKPVKHSNVDAGTADLPSQKRKPLPTWMVDSKLRAEHMKKRMKTNSLFK